MHGGNAAGDRDDGEAEEMCEIVKHVLAGSLRTKTKEVLVHVHVHVRMRARDYSHGCLQETKQRAKPHPGVGRPIDSRVPIQLGVELDAIPS